MANRHVLRWLCRQDSGFIDTRTTRNGCGNEVFEQSKIVIVSPGRPNEFPFHWPYFFFAFATTWAGWNPFVTAQLLQTFLNGFGFFGARGLNHGVPGAHRGCKARLPKAGNLRDLGALGGSNTPLPPQQLIQQRHHVCALVVLREDAVPVGAVVRQFIVPPQIRKKTLVHPGSILHFGCRSCRWN